MDVVVNGTKDTLPPKAAPLLHQANYYYHLLILLGFTEEQFPLASLLCHYHGLEGPWLIASPIYWSATHNDAMISATGEALELTEEESHQLFTDVADFLEPEGFTLLYHDAETWLLSITNKPLIASEPLPSLLGRSLMPVLAKLDSTLYWQRLFTEMQMFLSNHPVASKRENKLPINGLWFWGEGSFRLNSHRLIATDDEYLLALANPQNHLIALQESTVLTKNHLLLIRHPETIKRCRLEEKIKKHKAQWYWNNLAYSIPASPWWSKLWRV